jgi:hypothetical protein
LDVAHRVRTGQLPQATPQMTLRVGVIERVMPGLADRVTQVSGALG